MPVELKKEYKIKDDMLLFLRRLITIERNQVIAISNRAYNKKRNIHLRAASIINLAYSYKRYLKAKREYTTVREIFKSHINQTLLRWKTV